MSGRVEAIHVAEAADAPMRALAEAECRADLGLVGDRYARPGTRSQVTVISAEALAEAASLLGLPIPPGATRRNVTVSGVDLPAVGGRLRLGPVLLEITGPADPCELMNTVIGPGAREALAGRAGLRGRVLAGGILRRGDAATHDAGPPTTLATSTLIGHLDLAPSALGLNLPRANTGLPSESDLVAFARDFRMTAGAWAALAPHIGFDVRQYRRVRLFRGDEWEALLLCWLPGQGTNVHDHGGSVGVSAVLAGSLREIRYSRQGEGQPLAIAGQGDCPASAAAVELADTIHEMRNDGSVPAISLHVYSPPLVRLGAHDPALGTRWEVAVADSPDVQVGGDPRLPA